MPELYTASDITRISGAAGADATREHGRSPFRKDYGRLLHAPSFRRLQGKTQLFPGTESDFFRNRLTHSLEVAQIAGGIAQRLNASNAQDYQIDLDLVQFAGLAHDLGHPPFGHNGERALDELMREFGGFESNAQTLHILAQVERKIVLDRDGVRRDDCGLDLCYRTLASILKYDHAIAFVRPAEADIDKGYYASEASLVETVKVALSQGHSGQFKTLECQLMELADDIAYSTYDLEDSMHAGFVTPLTLIDSLINDEGICATVLRKTNRSLLQNSYESVSFAELCEAAAGIFGDTGFGNGCSGAPDASELLKAALAGVQCFTVDRNLSTNGKWRTRFTAERIGELIGSVEFVCNESHPAFSTVRLTRDALIQVEILKHLNFELVIRSPRLAVVEYRGKDIVRDIFKALHGSNGSLLPNDWKGRYRLATNVSGAAACRVICDFVAGMTDRYAVEFHSAIAGEGASIFRPL
ncbi:deoxyguanosinetriphosphate triphosphohydrolase-like protein [Steroidobacter agaridevorans]|uniref:Deoxyguanosinetriphosphate triphosphohydrolase-like protein n=1 Tax=Steroidobacter agaridevorans TaxID=2695856 RepID=A0A829Y546_9GAMM|nr:dNTP triphosphohydrolase [Steroidobacter agaridevorans]GFE78213.1 deoxyguanosinetriphosphate triphosphohydrolase-like protein [Steroidobacter agaridevorans]